jgi:aminoglycoside/choline kinase family phosphotransferase
LEDLGDATLEVVLRDQTIEAWGQFYRRAIDELLSIQIRESKKQDGRCIAFGRAFDVPLLMWEFDHFLEYGIEARHGKAIPEPDRSRIRVLFQEISERLAKEPRCLTHRDYHSRNLVVQGDRIRVLDFQDALMGPYQYDLASLLRDSYVTLPEGLVDSLIDYYLNRREALEGVPIDHDYFREIFDLMSIQRNLKAAGRFVYIDRVKHNPLFLPYVAPTLGYVKRNLSRYPALESLGQLLRPFVEEFNLP